MSSLNCFLKKYNMSIRSMFRIFDKEIILKFFLVILLFLVTLVAFKLFQNPRFYRLTLNRVTFTYYFKNDKNNIHQVEKCFNPYARITDKNVCNWDGSHYKNIKDNYYDSGKGDKNYAFFPLFPLLWKISFISDIYIGLFNYLLFGISIVILSSIFLNKKGLSLTDRLFVFTLSLILPTIAIYYLPYAEALYTLTFVIALWGLVKNKYWVYFIFILLFSMTRPTIMVFVISIVMLDLFYFLKHRNVVHFVKELVMKLLPVAIGVGIVFFMYYLNSGSFTKYFETVYKYWPSHFSIPEKISDWSVESYGMNVFTIFFIIFPTLGLFIYNAIKFFKSEKPVAPPSIFNGNINFIKKYFLNNSIIHFWGVFLCVVFYQGGSLNGLSRYVFVSPFFYTFLYIFYNDLREINWKRLLLVFLPALAGSLLLLLNALVFLDPKINFSDMGFFTFLFSLISLLFLKYMNDRLKLAAMLLLAFCNIIWITYLYNIYICDGWIFT